MNHLVLTQVALLGTERQVMPKAEPRTALERLQVQINPVPGEQVLLSAAALTVVHELAGRLPARQGTTLPAPSAPETLPLVGSRAGDLLLNIQSGQYPEFLPEWLTCAARAGQLAPPETLPELLTAGAEKSELRELIPPVLGERGRWLSAQNSAWAWVRGVEDAGDEVWHTGNPAARQLFLQRLHSQDSTRARELLAATWKNESPDGRLTLISALEIAISPADEPFLESVLDDKRKEVRRTAAGLLARLPGSALVQRMIVRAAPLLKFTPGKPGGMFGLKKAGPAALEVMLPAACDKETQRDGVELKPPAGTGEKIWWLRQMLEAVPLVYWTNMWSATPADILAASFASEWKKELFYAWTSAAIRQRNGEWAQLLFPAAVKDKQLEIIKGLLRVLPTVQIEAELTRMLAVTDADIRDMCGFLVLQCQHAWSVEFSRQVLDWLRKLTATPSNDWQLRNQLKNLAGRLSPGILPETVIGWPVDSPGWESWGKGMDELLAAARFRLDLIQSFTSA